MNELETLRNLFITTKQLVNDLPDTVKLTPDFKKAYAKAEVWLFSTPLPLNQLGKETNEINKANGWHIPSAKDWTDSEYIIPTFLMLIVSEVSEAFEAFRKDNEVNFVEEMADIFIRLVNLAEGLGIDLDTAVKEKLEKNRKRSYRHGGKRV